MILRYHFGKMSDKKIQWIKDHYGQKVPDHTIITYNDGTTTAEVEVGTDGILTRTLVRDAGDYTTIQSVEIGSDVTSIGTDAFFGCSSLTSVAIPSSVTVIKNYVFYNCSGLTNVILENRTLDEAQSLIGTTNHIGYTGVITYDGGTYNTTHDSVGSGGSDN